jgi:uncharacterized Zn finger protein
MKVACPHCQRYYSLDQEKTGIIHTEETLLTCELCGGISTITIIPVESKSMARRIVVQRECKSEEGGFSE